jgi:5-methylcytosine-specific restriction enzyme subunit McrC
MTALAVDNCNQNSFGFVGQIPVRNLWLLMLYASDLYRSIGKRTVAIEDSPDDIPDLVAEILTHAVEERLRQNLSSGFRQREAELTRVRGRIDILTTERRQLLTRGKVACTFEELSIDTPRNRLVLVALLEISTVVSRQALSHRCLNLAKTLKRLGVSGLRPTRSEISTERFGRNDAKDRLMVAAAQLALNIALPTEEDGSKYLAIPDREEIWVRRLYERAVGGFYRTVLSQDRWRVYTGKTLNWQINAKTTGIDSILPSMRTDVVLENIASTQRIVIDTKFNSIVTKGWFRDETVRSGYVYQIYAYLMSQTGSDDPFDQCACGLLLHPSIGQVVDETVIIQGHPVRFSTVDLSSPATAIRQQLLAALDFPFH